MIVTTPALDSLDRVRHGFFTREGGVSRGIFASLNCGFGSGDDADSVAANRARALAALDLPPRLLANPYQVHGTAVAVVDRPWAPGAAPRADGVVSRTPGIALGVLTADCAPVLLADAEAGVIGAAHAGWRGALAGIVEATVAAMAALGADRAAITAAVGPCIAQQSYEVGPEFPAPFLAADPDAASYFIAAGRPGHHRFDLAGYVGGRLARLGLAEVAFVAADTCAEEARFFSYRRTTLAGGSGYGRALSAIALIG